jgi:SAM-dependent methyltransferase
MPDEMQRRWVASMPAAYDRWLVPTVFRPFAVDLSRRIADDRPARLLELAAGTGVLTAELLAGGSIKEITATDLNEAMVELGRSRAPGAVWQQADAMALPFEDGRFDAVACQFGVMFFPDKPAGFAEARRVLAPGGALFFNTWAPIDTHEFEVAVTAGLAEAFPGDPPTFLATTPHGYSDPGAVAADVRAGGFEDVVVETVTVEGHAGSAADLATGYCNGTPILAEIEARSGDLAAVTAAVARALEARFGTGPVTGRMGAHVVRARTAGPGK